jgi:hypothetical protein
METKVICNHAERESDKSTGTMSWCAACQSEYCTVCQWQEHLRCDVFDPELDD